MPDSEVSEQFLSRALDFVSSAKVLCEGRTSGWLPSACLLIGMACELIAKKQLVERGVSKERLKYSPYGHDLGRLWKEHTSLFNEAKIIFDEMNEDNAFPSSFSLELHFDTLSQGFGGSGDYSIRYHNGVRTFADPCSIGMILSEVCRRERMRRQRN